LAAAAAGLGVIHPFVALQVLKERNFPYKSIKLLASAR
jgi:hypothetical protein